MESKNFLKDVYDDFFGIEKIRKENENLRRELNLKDDYPEIEIDKNEKEKIMTKEEKDKTMAELFEKIDNLYIKEESKETLKKIVEYLRKYNEGIEKQYIPFDMCIY